MKGPATVLDPAYVVQHARPLVAAANDRAVHQVVDHAKDPAHASLTLGATSTGDVLLGLGLAVAGALIATALLASARLLVPRLRKTLPELNLAFFSMCNLVWLVTWLGLDEVRISRVFLGETIGIPSRTTLGTLVAVHYVVSGADRRRRGMDVYSRTAPFAAAITTIVLIILPGSFYGGALAFPAAALYLIGYFKSSAYGRHTFGIAVLGFATAGGLATCFGEARPGEVLLVFAGIVAGSRSITAFLKNVEDRNPPPPPAPSPVADTSSNPSPSPA